MAEISRSALFGKLNSLCYRAMEAATVFCKHRANPYVELAHWIHQLLQLQDSDLHRILRAFEIDTARLVKDLVAALDRLPRGASSISDLSTQLEEAVERGWVYGSLLYGASAVRSGYVVVGLVKTKSLQRHLTGISEQFAKIKPDTLSDDFARITAGSVEDELAAKDGTALGSGAVPGEASGAMAPATMGKGEALKRFAVDLTARARNGEIDPIVGRDLEIRQVIDILMRRRQNNPILTGEAGVGKTAVVEGLALRIAAGDLPPALRDVRLLTLDVGLLQAGASMKGEFENRLRQVIEEVHASETPIILFIDEAHTLIGAGGAAGTGDAANLLKPALARGTLRTIAATTWAEYKKHIEKDPALTRRFQVVQVHEPSEEKAVQMMRGVAGVLEKHHGVQILDEAIRAAVALSHRYIPARQLPDKSVSLLDTACARVALSQHAEPPEVEDCRRRIEALEVERGILEREAAIGVEVAQRLGLLDEERAAAGERLQQLEERWGEERRLCGRILELMQSLSPGQVAEAAESLVGDAQEGGPAASGEAPLDELRRLERELAGVQGQNPLMLPSVDEQAIAKIVSDWTGIPVGSMVADEIRTILELPQRLEKRVVGQNHGLEVITRRVQTSRAQLDNPNRPIGVFLLVGPSGVGKTETALALAETLYGGEQNLITINMSEFQEAHTVSTLKGAPPGYVGYGEGGVLTEAVRRRPYSVVLLDEVEKAHSDVHEIFFQVFDKGQMEDGEGRMIDFKNTLILLTSNVGSDAVMAMCKDPELMPEPEQLGEALRGPLLKTFPAALLGRMVVVPYYPLSDQTLQRIARLQLDRIVARMRRNHGVTLGYDDAVVEQIIRRCKEVESGGRMIDAILTNTLLPVLSQHILETAMAGGALADVRIEVKDGQFAYAF